MEFFDIPNGGSKTLKARMFKPPGLKEEEEEGTKYPMVLHV